MIFFEFQKYLSYSCVYFKKAGYLHTLYDFQILMKDYVRAAMICIRFYQKKAVTFTDLVSRSAHLHTALKHFEEELHIQSTFLFNTNFILLILIYLSY